jgi:hypothetical protein
VRNRSRSGGGLCAKSRDFKRERKDIIASGIVNVVRLTKIFRQAQGSAIITNALNKSEISIRYGGTVFKLGDKVMQIKKQL